MTLNEARKLFRSLKYYDRLSQSIRGKQTRLAYLIEECAITRIDGYEIESKGSGIFYRKLHSESYMQLALPLDGLYTRD